MNNELRIMRLNARQHNHDQLFEVGKLVLSNPVLTGLTGIGINELAYRAGLYEPLQGEKEESLLGGPTWITIGSGLPVAQQRRNLINGFIIAASTAWALSGGINPIRSIGAIAEAVK